MLARLSRISRSFLFDARNSNVAITSSSLVGCFQLYLSVFHLLFLHRLNSWCIQHYRPAGYTCFHQLKNTLKCKLQPLWSTQKSIVGIHAVPLIQLVPSNLDFCKCCINIQLIVALPLQQPY